MGAQDTRHSSLGPLPCPGCGRASDRPGKRCRECRRVRSAERPAQRKRRGSSGPRQPVYTAITEAEWVRLYKFQEGRCAICRTELMNRYAPGSTEGQLAYLDHDHKIEKTSGLRASVRGLLCLWCNRHILVALHDRAEKARRAYVYLATPPAPRLLDLDAPKEVS